MKLMLENGDEVQNPTEKDIAEAFQKLETEEISFIILDTDRPEPEFIQVAGEPGLLMLEYREEGIQFRCEDESVTLEQVKRIFNGYVKGSKTFNSSLLETFLKLRLLV